MCLLYRGPPSLYMYYSMYMHVLLRSAEQHSTTVIRLPHTLIVPGTPCHPAALYVRVYTTRATLRVCVSRSTCNPCHTGVRLGAHASTVLIHMQENIIMNQPRPTTGVGRTAGRVEASGSSSLPEPLMTVQFVNSGLSPSSSYSTQDCPPRPPTIL